MRKKKCIFKNQLHVLWDYKDYILILSALLFIYITTIQSPGYVGTLTDLTWLDVFYVNLTNDFQML